MPELQSFTVRYDLEDIFHEYATERKEDQPSDCEFRDDALADNLAVIGHWLREDIRTVNVVTIGTPCVKQFSAGGRDIGREKVAEVVTDVFEAVNSGRIEWDVDHPHEVRIMQAASVEEHPESAKWVGEYIGRLIPSSKYPELDNKAQPPYWDGMN